MKKIRPRTIPTTEASITKTTSQAPKIRQRDLQVLTNTIRVLPISIYKLYQTLTMSMTTKSPLRLAIEGFIFQLTVLVSYINGSIIFLIYTLSGKIFRKELLRMFQRQSALTSSMQQTTRTTMRIQGIQ
ncbi:unnamed protein product [Didymodactylos carnosus]|uniref:Uncharacterized protein n=1 Tax=Didymodactylos carnosus TaxID=1234261 RepID=A0A815L9J5_9BILA|nr:unnamed protein product [Didymodactylos carnosus]CAF1401301.1 unnamed protein product [Didymodactylos carnosus]CAF3638047.1 unnamed protein product [Didymodactylos carnosus]CAF4295128.1 unnamed protein product [Didymodactylos carnosus]